MSNTARAQAIIAANVRTSILEHAANNGGHAHVAEQMGIEYSTWWNSLNRNANPIDEDAARLTIYCARTGNLEPLRFMADACGYYLCKKPDMPPTEHDIQHDAVVIVKEAADTALAALDGKETKFLRRKLEGIRDRAGDAAASFGGRR